MPTQENLIDVLLILRDEINQFAKHENNLPCNNYKAFQEYEGAGALTYLAERNSYFHVPMSNSAFNGFFCVCNMSKTELSGIFVVVALLCVCVCFSGGGGMSVL